MPAAKSSAVLVAVPDLPPEAPALALTEAHGEAQAARQADAQTEGQTEPGAIDSIREAYGLRIVRPLDALAEADSVLEAEPGEVDGDGDGADPSVRAWALDLKADALLQLDRPAEALDIASEPVTLFGRLSESRGLAAALLHRGWALFWLGQIDEAEVDLEQAAALWSTLPQESLSIDCERIRAVLAWHGSDSRRSLKGLEHALTGSRSLGDTALELRVRSNLGLVHRELGNHPEALLHLQEALPRARELGAPMLLGSLLIQSGQLHAALGQPDTAEEHLVEAHSLFTELGATSRVALIETKLAQLAAEAGEPVRALRLADASVDRARRSGLTGLLATAQATRGSLRGAQGDFVGASQDVAEAVMAFQARGDEPGRLDGETRMARLKIEQARQAPASHPARAQLLNEADEALLAVIERARERRPLCVEAHEARVDLLRLRGDVSGALQEHILFHQAWTERVAERDQLRLDHFRVVRQLEEARVASEWERDRNSEVSATMEELERANAQLREAAEARDELLAQVREQAQQLSRLARQDALTGLANRRHAEERLEAEVGRQQRYGTGLAIALADVDRFKDINDRWSHVVGDAVLRRLSEIFSGRLRSCDFVGRYGGEEFVFVFPELDEAACKQLCEELRVLVADEDWSRVADGLEVTVSFGWAIGNAGREATDLLRAADVGLLRAKRKGRNRVIRGV